jgi:hypothetical protein
LGAVAGVAAGHSSVEQLTVVGASGAVQVRGRRQCVEHLGHSGHAVIVTVRRSVLKQNAA